MPPRRLLNIEGLATLGFGIFAYWQFDVTWWLFVVLFFAPDLSMLTMPLGRRISTFSYNLLHTYSSPAVLALAGYLLDQSLLLALAAIWVSHIGFDRILGYGLKYAWREFRETHIQQT